MADFAMFGPEQGGQRLAGLDQQAAALSRLTQQKTQAETQHYQALAQQEMQKAALEKQQAETQQMQQAQMQRIALMHKGESLADQTKAQIEGGFLMGSIKSSLEASQTLNQLAQTSNHLAQAEGKQAEDAAKKFELLGRVAKNTNTQEDFEKNIKILEGTGVKVPDAIKNARWTPEIKQRLIDLSENQIKEREEKRKENDEIRKEDISKQQILVEKARVDLVKAQTAEAWAKTEKEKKAGGDKVLRAPPEDRRQVENLIRNEFGGTLDAKGNLEDPGAASVAEIVASNAQDLMAKNRGLTRANAIAQAYKSAHKGLIESVITPAVPMDLMRGKLGSKASMETSFHPERVGETAPAAKKEGKVTTTKPAGASDADWAAYKKEMGIK